MIFWKKDTWEKLKKDGKFEQFWERENVRGKTETQEKEK